jgi:hypothetical protein
LPCSPRRKDRKRFLGRRKGYKEQSSDEPKGPAKVQTPGSDKARWLELLEEMMDFAVDVIVYLRFQKHFGSNAFYPSI